MKSRNKIVYAGLNWLLNPEKVLRKAEKKHGLSFYLWLPFLGKTFVTGHPSHINNIKINKELVGGRGMTILRPVLGNDNLIMLEGTKHKQRKIGLNKMFTRARIIEFDKVLTDIFQHISKKYHEKSSINSYSFFQEILLVAIIEFLFSSNNQKAKNILKEDVSNFFHSMEKSYALFFRPLQINCGRHNRWGRMLIKRKRLQETIGEMVNKENFLWINEEGIDTHQIIEEMIALLLFGHDTSAAALAWTTHHCLDNPSNIKKLLKDPMHLEAVIFESMRINPVVVHLTRVANSNLNLGLFEIKKGMKILPCAYLAHFNKSILKNPYDFIPERFHEVKNIKDFYFPFGFGDRICIGKHFSLQQMRILLPLFFKTFQVEKTEEGKTKAVRDNVIMVPKGDFRINKIKAC